MCDERRVGRTNGQETQVSVQSAFPAGAATAAPVPINVFAQANSTSGGVFLDTGIDVGATDILVVSVAEDDCWSAGVADRTTNANGLVGFSTNACRPVATFDYGLHNQFGQSFPYATLVGRIGLAGTPFVVGTDFNAVLGQSGRLYFAFWDSNSGDNTGFITANVDVVPEPATLALLGAGLSGVIARRRRRR